MSLNNKQINRLVTFKLLTRKIKYFCQLYLLRKINIFNEEEIFFSRRTKIHEIFLN